MLKYNAKINDVDKELEISLEEVRLKLQNHLSQKENENLLKVTSDKTARRNIIKEIQDYCISNAIKIKNKTLDETIEILTKDILDYSVLTDLILDENIEEIRVNDYNDIRVVANGKEEKSYRKFQTPEECLIIAQKLCRNSKSAMVKPDKPFIRARLGNNIRVSIMTNPVARRQDDLVRPVVQITIRKQRSKPITSDFLIKNGSINEFGDKLIEFLIKNKISTAFYGGTNTGKTGTMNSYIHRIENDTRTISIAEIDEMNSRKIDSITQEAKNSALMWEIKEKIKIGFREAINYSLTFTPEVLILQEIKGAETVDVIDASITGHQVITSLHADNVKVFGKRILGMYKQSGSDLDDDLILDYVSQSFDLLVRMKLYKDGQRRITSVDELIDYDRNTGKFITKNLIKYQVYDTKIITENESIKYQILGQHKVQDFISKELQDKLLDNGASLHELKKLKNWHEQLKQKDDKVCSI